MPHFGQKIKDFYLNKWRYRFWSDVRKKDKMQENESNYYNCKIIDKQFGIIYDNIQTSETDYSVAN